MCNTPSIPQDTSAQQAAAAQAQREARVTEGQQNIDSAFGKFDDNYFGNYRQSYLDNYNPQADQQFGDASRELRYNDARRHMLDSTSAIFNADQLNRKYGDARQQIAGDAVNATDQLRGQVQQQKAQLYAQNTASADPTLASTQAAASAGTIPSTSQYSALGDLFGGLVNSAASYQAGANRNNPYYTNMPLPGAGKVPSGGGSGKVVR